MAGAAERALSARHRAIADELRAIAEWPVPPYGSTSGFRFAYDRSASRDLADTSAVAQQLDVATRAIMEQPLALASTIGSTTEPEPAPADPDAFFPFEDPVDDRHLGLTSVRTTEALLTVPSSVAAREKADQACRALNRGWHAEAEELFREAAELVPTEPFVWFGAGLAAGELDPARAADHLV